MDDYMLSKSHNHIKKAFALKSMVFLAVCSFSLCSCALKTYKHRPYMLRQVNMIFEDSNGNAYSRMDYYNMVGNLEKYSASNPSHQEYVLIKEGDTRLYYDDVAANSSFLFAAMHPYANSTFSTIKIFDKEFNMTKSFDVNEGHIRGLSCSETGVYWTLRTNDENVPSLYRYDIEKEKISLVASNVEKKGFYKDDDIHLFFDDFYSIWKFDTKTYLTRYVYDDDGYAFLKADGLELRITSKNIEIKNQGQDYTFKNKWGSYWWKYKAVLIDNFLLFATCRNVKNNKCGSLSNVDRCICGMKESYLFCFNTETNELKLLNEYESGTFLIDYDLENVAYYYKGGLYINGVLSKECELVEDVKEEPFGIFDEWTDYQKEYFVGFSNNTFYGI